jgi:hypothetical protein
VRESKRKGQVIWFNVFFQQERKLFSLLFLANKPVRLAGG